MEKGDDSGTKMNFQISSGGQRDIHLKHHSWKNHENKWRNGWEIMMTTKRKNRNGRNCKKKKPSKDSAPNKI